MKEQKINISKLFITKNGLEDREKEKEMNSYEETTYTKKRHQRLQ